LRNFIDRLFAETFKVPKKWIRTYDTDNFYEKEQTPPFRAPKWTVGNYQGSLKDLVEEVCKNRSSGVLPVEHEEI
jgi:hypothetical protein